MKKQNLTEDQKYDLHMHNFGSASMLFIFLVLMAVPFVISFIFGEPINFSKEFWIAFIPILLVNIPGCIVEVITYTPLLGTGGTYLAFITGNLSNLKIPCAMNARQLVNAKMGSKESEIASTLAVASSAIVTTIILILGVVLIIPLKPILESKVLLPAFKTVVPAVFGALGYKYAIQYPKISFLPLVIAIGLFLLFPSLTSSVSMMVFAMAIIAIVYAFIMFKKGKVK